VIAVILAVVLCGGLSVAPAPLGGGLPAPTIPPVVGPQVAPPPVTALLGGIDLSGWKLTIPVSNHKGHATTVRPVALVPPWVSAIPGGGLLLWAPSTGATTEHSDHPRTELDSMSNFTAARWVHRLTASMTLLRVPQDGQGIILGQIHGAGEISSVPYVMLRHQGGGIIVVVKQVRDGEQHVNYPLLGGVPLNCRFDFTITDLGNGKLAFSATLGSRSRGITVAVPPAFTGQAVRFQAGDYQQADRPAGGQDGGEVIVHTLSQSTTAP
jgi:hypothetical protein